MRLLACLLLLLPGIARADRDELIDALRMDSGTAEMQRWQGLKNQEQIVREMRRMNRNLERLVGERGDRGGLGRGELRLGGGVLGERAYDLYDGYDRLDEDRDDYGE